MNLVGRCLSHFGQKEWIGLGGAGNGSAIKPCMTSMGSTVSFVYVDRTENRL